MKTLLRSVVVVAVMVAAVVSTHAATISVNLGDGLAGNVVNGLPAGVNVQTLWNEINGTSAVGVALTDSASGPGGNLSFAGGLNPSISTPAGGDERMLNSMVASFAGTMTFNISNVPYATYDLLAYAFPGSFDNNVVLSITVGATTYYGRALNGGQTNPGYIDNNSGTAFNYLQATSTSLATPTTNANYWHFTGLTGSLLAFSVTDHTNNIPVLNGFQIVDTVPEPGSALLLLGGACALGLRRLRRAGSAA